MSDTPASDDVSLREIDQIGYEAYRYLLDLIYNAGGLHEDHYKLKDKVDSYIVNLIAMETAKARIDELNHIWKEVVNHDIAGPVKWEIEDRIAALSAHYPEPQLDSDINVGIKKEQKGGEE